MITTTGQITNPIIKRLNNYDGITFVSKLIPSLVTLAIIVGVVIFFSNLILGAIQWISSGGDKQGLEAAKSKVTNAIVGLVILFAVFAVLRLIQTFFGITIMALDIGSLKIQ